VIRIAVSPRAYRAIKATLPAGSVVYPPERIKGLAVGRAERWAKLVTQT
jgi:hypothetical protein